MSDMKHISQVPAGYLVRKTVNGRLYQRFFSDSKYGNNQAALKAAKDYRDELLEEVKGQRSFQSHNAGNVTGIVGVAWHLRRNEHRGGAIVHTFRAQVAGEDGKQLSRAWSVQRYGLWHAYEQAARWRHMVAFGKAMKSSDIISNFVIFLGNYTAEMKDAGDLYGEMRDALVDLSIDPSTPKEIIAALPKEITKRFESKRPKLAVVAGTASGASDSGQDPLGIYSGQEQSKKSGS